MKPLVKRIWVGVGAAVGVVVVGFGAFIGFSAYRFGSSMDHVYDVPIPAITPATDAAVIARGHHLAEAVAGCVSGDCHGADLGGGKTLELGPLGKLTGPNISQAGLGAAYSDGELFRLVRNGLKKDGRSVRFMPSHEIGWLPDADIVATISYLRTLPPSTKPNGPNEIGLLAKVLDRLDLLVIDVARRIDQKKPEVSGPAEPTAAYGRHLAKLCTGCHGANLSGGPIPGAPPELPVPLNITLHETGLKGWSYEDFDKLMVQGIRKNGQKLDPFMPISGFGKMDEVEKKALWAHLLTVPRLPFGER